MRILIIEDDQKIAATIQRDLQDNQFTVDHAANGEDGLALARQNRYDASIVDIMLPQMDGLTCIQQMRAERIQTPVLVLSAKHSVDDRIRGLQVGSDDYLTKPFAISELLVRVQALIRRHNISENEPSKLQVGDLKLNFITREVERAGRKIELQPREFALLVCFMRNPGQTISKIQILKEVWDFDFVPTSNIVDVLVCRLRNKIDRDFETPMIQTLRSTGYVFNAAE